jgi:RNA polymerase sigma factor (sigma-70 family)
MAVTNKPTRLQRPIRGGVYLPTDLRNHGTGSQTSIERRIEATGHPVCQGLEARKLKSLEEYIGKHRVRLTRLAYSMIGNWDDAEEVLQDACVEAIRCCVRYDEHTCGVGTWLNAVLRNRVLDRLRSITRQSHQIAGSLDDPDFFFTGSDNPINAYIEGERTCTVIRALSMCDQRDQFILTRFLLHDDPGRSVAVMLECSEAALRNRVMHAKRRLRSMYNYLKIVESLEE